nr:MAG: virion RNA polymerase [Enquatrovirus sp.]
MAIDIQSILNNAMAQTQALNPKRLRVNYDDVNAAPADRQMQAIQANVQENPNAIKAQSVLNAAERKRKALGLQHEQNQAEDTALRLAGRTEEEVQANASRRSILQNMNEVERAENYQRYKANDPSAVPDPYLDYDMNQLDDMELEARYGKAVANMKRASVQNIIGLTQQATQQSMHSGLDTSWYNPRNIVGSLLTGTGNTVDSTGDALDALYGLSSGNMEQAYKNMQAEGIGTSMAKAGSSMLGSDYQAENERARALEQLDNIVVDQLAQQKTTYGTEEELARKEANEEVGSNALDRLANANQLYQQGLQQAPEFLAGAGVASLVRKGTTAGIKKLATSAIEDAAERRAKQEAAKFAKGSIARTMASKEANKKAEDAARNLGTRSVDDTLKAAILKDKAITRAEAVKEKLADKAAALYKKNADKQATKIAEKAGNVSAAVGLGAYYGAREGAGAASEAYEQIKGMNQDYVVNSPEGKKLQEQHPDWTKEQIQEEIAQNAGSIAYMRQGATSFVSSAILAGAEQRAFGFGRGSNLKQSTANYTKSVAGEMGQEYAEEYGGTYNPRVAINQALGKEHFKESTGDLTAKAHVRGVSGAITAGLTTGVTNAHEIVPTGAKAVANKVKETTAKKVEAKQKEQLQPHLTNADGSDTELNKAVKATAEELKPVAKDTNPEFKKAIEDGDFIQMDKHFSKQAELAQKRLDTGTSKDVEADTTLVKGYEEFKAKIGEGFEKDFHKTSAEIQKELSAIEEQVTKDLENKLTSQEQVASLVQEAQENGAKSDEEIQAYVVNKFFPEVHEQYKKLEAMLERNNKLQEFIDSPIGRKLTETSLNTSNQDSTTTDDINIGSTGKASQTIPEGLASVKKRVEQASKELENIDTSTEEGKSKWKQFEQDFSKAFFGFDTKGGLDVSEAKQAWKDMSNYLGSLREVMVKHKLVPHMSGTIAQLHKAISDMQKVIENNPSITDNQAKVLFDKFIGSKGKQGLLTYAQKAMRNGGKLSARDVSALNHFLLTQSIKGLQFEALTPYVQSFENDELPSIKIKNNALKRGDKIRNLLDDGDIKFTSKRAFNAYRKALKVENQVFSDLAKALIDGSNNSFNFSPKTEKPTNTSNTKDKESKKDLKEKSNSDNLQTKDKQTNTTTKEPAKNSSKSHHTVKKVFSGGAYGADAVWSRIAKENGVNPKDITHFVISELGSNIAGERQVYNAENGKLIKEIETILEGERPEPFKKIVQQLKTNYIRAKNALEDPNNSKIVKNKQKAFFAAQLQLRNVLQVVNADAIFAVNGITKNGVLERSGTNTAIRLGLAKGIPVYVLNPNDAKWYSLQDGKWTQINRPYLTSEPALVGTRSIESYKQYDRIAKTYVNTEVHENSKAVIEEMEALFKQEKGTNQSQETKSEEVTEDIWYGNGQEHPLSNLAPRPFTITHKGGVTRKYGSVEHYYQTWKSGSFDEMVYSSYVKGTKPKPFLKVDKTKSEEIMKYALTESFKQNPEALGILRATKGKILTHEKDKGHWKEAFPRLLMEVRDELKDYQKAPESTVEETSQEDDGYVPTEEERQAERDTAHESRDARDMYDNVDNYIEETLNTEPVEEIKVEPVTENTESTDVTEDGLYKDLNEEEFEKVESDEVKPNTTASIAKEAQPRIDNIIDTLWKKINDKAEVSMSMLTALRARGISYKYNPLAKAKFKLRNRIDSELVRNAVVRGNASDVIKLFGLTEEEFEALDSRTLDKNNSLRFGKAWITMYKNLSHHFMKTELSYAAKLNKKSLTENEMLLELSPLMYFANINEEGNRLKFTGDFMQAMTKAVFKTINELAGKQAKADQVIESLEPSEDQTVEVILMNKGNNNTKDKDDSMIGLDEKVIKQRLVPDANGNRQVQHLVDSLSNTASTLGSNKEVFIDNLGKNAIRELGIVLDPKDVRINQGIITALGLELYTSMLEQNMLTVQRVQYYTDGKPEQYIDHVNFAWNTGFKHMNLTQQDKDAINAQWNDARSPNANVSIVINGDRTSALSKDLSYFSNMLAGRKSTGAEKLFPEENKVYGGVKVSTKDEHKPFKATQEDVATALTSGSNTEALSYIQAANDIAYKPNTRFHTMVMQGFGVDLAKRIFGYKDVSKMNAIDRLKESQQSRNNQIDRSMAILDFYLKDVDDNGDPVDISDKRYYLKHKLMSNTRIQVDSDLNPLSDKIIREMILATIEYEEDVTKFNPKLPITEWLDTLNENSSNHEVGYARALAQALGIKIERVYDADAFTQLKKLLSDQDSAFNQMVQMITHLETEGGLSDFANVGSIADAFYNEFGNGTPRALQAAMTVANFAAAVENDSEFQSLLMLEVDGIGNGIHNSSRQFATRFSSTYFMALKRTGVVTADLLVQAKAENKDMDMVEGAKYIFDKSNAEDSMEDVYQVVSSKIAEDLKLMAERVTQPSNLTFFDELKLNQNGKELPITTLDNYLKHPKVKALVSTRDLDFFSKVDAYKKLAGNDKKFDLKTYNDFLRDYDSILTLRLMSYLEKDAIKANVESKTGKNIDVDIFNTNLVSLANNPDSYSKLVNNLVSEVSRGFSKAGVTPANYGGKLNGITNQLESTLIDYVNKLSQALYEAASTGDRDLVMEAGSRLQEFVELFPMNIKWANDKNLFNNAATDANNIANAFGYRKEPIKTLKNTLGKLMHNAINKAYGEQFNAIDYVIAMDNVLFEEFIDEFQASYAQAIINRNKRKGWAKYDADGNATILDPRAEDPLSKKETKDILANMQNSPVIATAMSNNNQLVNQLFNTGNSLIKTSYADSLDAKRTVSTFGESKVGRKEYTYNNRTRYFKNNKLTATIRDAYRSFDPAGAAALVQSVVATESTTQGKLAVALQKNGMAVQNVYDGAELLSHLKNIIGSMINKITNEVHLDNNLIEAFYHKVNRSGLRELVKRLDTKENSDGIKVIFEKVAKHLNEYKKARYEGKKAVWKDLEISLTNAQAKVLEAYANMRYADTMSNAEFNPNVDLFALERIRLYKNLGTIARNIKASNGKTSLNFKQASDLDAISYDHLYLTEAYNNYIMGFAENASKASALKYIEKNYLPAVINQFGGVNNGYVYNGKNKKALAVLERFKQYLDKQQILPKGFRTQRATETFVQFIAQDAEIQKVWKEQAKKAQNKLAPALLTNVTVKADTVGNFIKNLENTPLDPTLQQTSKALSSTIENLVGKATPIYTDKNEYLNAIAKAASAINAQVPNINLDNVNGYHQMVPDANGKPQHFIYVSDNNAETALHEIIHGIQGYAFDAYFVNPSVLSDTMVKMFDGLKAQMVDLASSYHNNPEVMKILNQANNQGLDGSLGYSSTSNDLFNSMANILHLFDNKREKELQAQYGDILAQVRSQAMKEFWAYSLSQPEALNRLRYFGMRQRSKNFYGLLDKLINLFNKIRDNVVQAFGYTKGKEAPPSYLIDALTLINGIAHEQVKNPVKLNDITQGNAKVKVKPRNRLLFQVAGLTSVDTDKSASEVFKDVVDTSNISDAHGEYLQDLFDTVNNAIQRHQDSKLPLPVNHAQAWDLIQNNDLAQSANDIVSDLAQVGLPMSDAEKTAFKLMYAVNQASYVNNQQLQLEASKVMEGLVQNINPEDFLHNGALIYNGTSKFNAVFNNNRNPTEQLAMVMALAQSNEQVRNYLNQATTDAPSKGIKKFNKKLAESFKQATVFGDVAKNISNFKDKSVIEKLGLVSANLEFQNNAGDIGRQLIKDNLLAEQQKQLDALQWVNEVSDGLSSQKLSNMVKAVGGFVLVGKGLNANDNDSTFRQIVQDVVDNVEFLKERPTFYTQVWRWFGGAYKDTQYAYKLRSKHAAMSDAVREKVGNAIHAMLEKEFKDLSKDQRTALHKGVMSIGLNKLHSLSGNLQVNVPDILSNPSIHRAEIKAFEKHLGSVVAQAFPQLNTKQHQQIENYLNWQVQGLGELMVKGIAKGSKNTSHGILPNAKAISAMPQLKAIMKLPDVDLATQEELFKTVQGLSVLHSIKYLSQADKNTVADLYRNNSKAMKALMAEMNDMDKNANNVDPNSLLGYDGYIHNKRNPNQQIKIVNQPSEEEHQQLVFMGWEFDSKLPNGESVYRTKHSLHNNWTSGAFGSAELSVRGANSVTGQSLRSTGERVDSKMKLGKELEQRMAKIMNTPNYYDNLEEYSHYRPIIDRRGFITGFEVDVSNEHRDTLIESTENDLASVGNYQARLVEEGITAKQNKENINTLNQIYNSAKDKKSFVRIDGEAKPKSNSNADIQFANRLNDFFYSLPAETRAYITEQGGLYVHRHEVDNLVGYYQASHADILNGRTSIPEPIVKLYVGFMKEFAKVTKIKSPAVLIHQAGRLSSEVASLTKDFILNRSMIVPAQNLLSNIIHLVTAGVPVNKVVPLMIEGYRNAKAFTDNQSRIIQLEHEILTRKPTPAQRAKLQAEITALTNANKRNPAKILIENGILTSVTDLSITNIKDDSDFTMLHKLGEKVGINKLQDSTPNFIRNILVQEGTEAHNAMKQLMDYGDFVAKYALYTHMTQNRGMDSEHSINVIRDEFVDYAMNRGALFDWANKVGLTWFLSYKLAIQKIFFRSLRRNALRTAAVWGSAKAAAKVVEDVPILNQLIEDTVMDQSYLFKHSAYHFTPHHTDILESHWIEKLLEAF